MKLHHVAVVGSSREKAERFYGELLGLEKRKESSLDAVLMKELFGQAAPCELLLYGGPHLAIEVFLPTPPVKAPALAHLCLVLEEREPFLQRCQEAGLPLRRFAKGDSVIVFVEDFDGNLFEIKEA